MMTESGHPKVVFAGDRDIAVDVLDFLNTTDAMIAGLLLPDSEDASHAEQLRDQCDYLDNSRVLSGKTFREPEGIHLLESISPDYIICVHFKYIVPTEVLELPSQGVLNLHPAYLPYNRGWHTPTWAIWDQTPYGATLHFMEPEVDAGDIVARKREPIRIDDTADELYNRVKRTEFDLFKKTWPLLAEFSYERQPQSQSESTSHERADINDIQQIHLEETVKTGKLLRKLRALTTNDPSEAAVFKHDGEQYRVQVSITPEKEINQ